MGKNKIRVERTTKTPEMIPSMFNWLEPDRQKRMADKLANVTKSDKDE